jgi:ribosomal protein S1
VSNDTIKLADLKLKTKLIGKVKKIELFGAFVDIGAERDGLLHISQLRKEKTNRVQDVLTLDQEVTVWVRKVDAATGRLDLTLMEPLMYDWDELKTGLIIKGKTIKVERFGAFVDIGAERPAFIHVREMMSGHVNDPNEVVKVGQEVEAKVIGVDRKKRRIDMSIKALDDFTPEEQEPEEKPVSAMEVALRQAMGKTGRENEARRQKKQSERHALDEAFERTRQHHLANTKK